MRISFNSSAVLIVPWWMLMLFLTDVGHPLSCASQAFTLTWGCICYELTSRDVSGWHPLSEIMAGPLLPWMMLWKRCPVSRKFIFLETVNLLPGVPLPCDGAFSLWTSVMTELFAWHPVHREFLFSTWETCHFQELLEIIFAARRQRLKIILHMWKSQQVSESY